MVKSHAANHTVPIEGVLLDSYFLKTLSARVCSQGSLRSATPQQSTLFTAPVLRDWPAMPPGVRLPLRSFPHECKSPEEIARDRDSEPHEIEHQIRLLAYEHYETRGREDGHEQEDWFRAKEEITIKKFRTATA